MSQHLPKTTNDPAWTICHLVTCRHRIVPDSASPSKNQSNWGPWNSRYSPLDSILYSWWSPMLHSQECILAWGFLPNNPSSPWPGLQVKFLWVVPGLYLESMWKLGGECKVLEDGPVGDMRWELFMAWWNWPQIWFLLSVHSCTRSQSVINIDVHSIPREKAAYFSAWRSQSPFPYPCIPPLMGALSFWRWASDTLRWMGNLVDFDWWSK